MTQKTNTKTKKIINTDSSLVIHGDFKNFSEFFMTSREKIYEKIIELFTEFLTNKKKKLTFRISAKIDGFNWETDFNFHRNETIVLRKDLMPYYEENENYEMCEKIIFLEKQLTNQK